MNIHEAAAALCVCMLRYWHRFLLIKLRCNVAALSLLILLSSTFPLPSSPRRRSLLHAMFHHHLNVYLSFIASGCLLHCYYLLTTNRLRITRKSSLCKTQWWREEIPFLDLSKVFSQALSLSLFRHAAGTATNPHQPSHRLAVIFTPCRVCANSLPLGKKKNRNTAVACLSLSLLFI